MRILLSNDDGIQAPGLRFLYRELRRLGQVCVVAPLQEKSTAGHSLTLHKPLRIVPVGRSEPDFYGVSGSPADCVYLGARQLMKGLPDLVVSGPNRGANLGQDVYYSGTVSAAREATILGVPSLAVSLAIDHSLGRAEDELHYESAAKIAVRLLRKLLEFPHLGVPKHTLLNLNVPDLPLKRIKGIKLARQGFRVYSGDILRRQDHRGRDYFWVGGKYQGFKREDDADCLAVDEGYASLTPVKLDSTDLPSLVSLAKLSREGVLFGPTRPTSARRAGKGSNARK